MAVVTLVQLLYEITTECLPVQRLSDRCSRVQEWFKAAGITFQELSGSLGDLGTFLPLVVALAATVQLDLGTTLLFTGLYNVASGVGFRIPMCVQPMKTIAAVALATPGLTLPEVVSAGLFVSGTMLLLGVTGLMNWFNAVIPDSIVRGIQLAVGLSLAQKGVTLAFQTGNHGWRPWFGVEGLLLGLASAAFLLVTTAPSASAQDTASTTEQRQPQCFCKVQQDEATELHTDEQQQPYAAEECIVLMADDKRQASYQLGQRQLDCSIQNADQDQHAAQMHAQPQSNATPAGPLSSSSRSAATVPSALLLVLLGLILTPLAHPTVLSDLSFGPSKPQLTVPTWEQFKSGVLKAGLAQLPLTSLNSCIAVTQLAQQLFPSRVAQEGWRWRPGTVAVSVGLMNLIGCWFGAFPCCHGAGGLAAQYKFGARSGAAPVFLGLLKIALALLFGSSLLQILQYFPAPLLGSMLLMSGLELASSVRKQTDARGCGFMLLTTAAIIGLRDTALGFMVGLGGYAAVVGYEWVQSSVEKLWRWYHT